MDETADKLDSMMELTLAHLQRRVAGGQLPQVGGALALNYFTFFFISFSCLPTETPRRSADGARRPN